MKLIYLIKNMIRKIKGNSAKPMKWSRKMIKLNKATKKEMNALARDAKSLIASSAFGARSGRVGSPNRLIAEAMTVAVFMAIKTGKAVEVTDLAPATDQVSAYYLAHRASRPAEARVGGSVKVHQMVTVAKETATTIEGYTNANKNPQKGARIFLVPAT